MADALATAAIENTGIKVDATLNRRYVAFKDPDRIAWELYMAADRTLEAVQAYFHGLRVRDVDAIPFAADASFESPLTPRLSGAAAIRDFLRGALPIIRDVRVTQYLAQASVLPRGSSSTRLSGSSRRSTGFG